MSAREFFDRIRTEAWPFVSSWPEQQQAEHVYLDFKRGNFDPATGKLVATDKDALARALSGFANTDGGVLVFGVDARSAGKGEPDVVQSIEPIPGLRRFAELVRETSKTIVEPVIAGLDLESVANPAAADEGVLAVLVPRSMGGPHRANGGEETTKDRYFMRTADSTKVMPHRLLAALFAAPPEPRFVLTASYNDVNAPIRFSLRNNGPGSASQVRVQVIARDGVGQRVGQWSVESPWQAGATGTAFFSARPFYPEEFLPVAAIIVQQHLLALPSVVMLEGRIDSLTSRPLHFGPRRILSGQALAFSHDGVQEMHPSDLQRQA